MTSELPPPFFVNLGMHFTDGGEGWAELRVTPTPDQHNTTGRVHGGIVATLVDTVTGAAIVTQLEQGTWLATTDLHVRYLRATPTGEELTATGRVVHLGRSTATTTAEVVDADGRLVATATAGYAIRRPEEG